MSIRTQILRVDIPNVRPYGFAPRLTRCGLNDNGVLHGHEFDFEAEIQFASHGVFGRDHTLAFDETGLSWGEQIRWYQPNPYPAVGLNPVWAQKDNEDVLDFADAHYRVGTKTVRVGWFGNSTTEPGWFLPWQTRPWRDLKESIVTYANPYPQKWKDPTAGNYQQAEMIQRKFEFAKWLVSSRNGRLTTILTDRPGLTKKCSKDDGTWQNSGGGGMRTLNRHTRRRVVMFTLSVGGHMATATQILETTAGVPTICKFIKPAITVIESENPILLARWRNQLDVNNANNFNTNQ